MTQRLSEEEISIVQNMLCFFLTRSATTAATAPKGSSLWPSTRFHPPKCEDVVY